MEYFLEQQEYINSLVEREAHSDTMRPLTPLERQHLEDWRAHFEPASRYVIDRRYQGEICPECDDPWCAGCEHADVSKT